jgi:hypothetical protein
MTAAYPVHPQFLRRARTTGQSGRALLLAPLFLGPAALEGVDHSVSRSNRRGSPRSQSGFELLRLARHAAASALSRGFLSGLSLGNGRK